jgi:hypothetical protein
MPAEAASIVSENYSLSIEMVTIRGLLPHSKMYFRTTAVQRAFVPADLLTHLSVPLFDVSEDISNLYPHGIYELEDSGILPLRQPRSWRI